MADEPKTINIFGFHIERSASFTSLAAFVLAIWGAAYSLVNYLHGAQPEFIQPERIVVFKDNCDHQSYPIANIVLRLSILNNAPKEYASLVHDIKVKFSVVGREYVYHSEKFTEFGEAREGINGKVGCAKNDDNLIYYVKPGALINTGVIHGGDLFAEEMLFVPYIPACVKGGYECYAQNYLKYSDFVRHILEKGENFETMDFIIEVLFDGGQHQVKTCTIATNKDAHMALENYAHTDVYCLNRLTL